MHYKASVTHSCRATPPHVNSLRPSLPRFRSFVLYAIASYCVFLRTVRTAMLNVPPLVLSLAFYGMRKKPFVLKGPKRSFYIRIIKRRVTL